MSDSARLRNNVDTTTTSKESKKACEHSIVNNDPTMNAVLWSLEHSLVIVFLHAFLHNITVMFLLFSLSVLPNLTASW